MLLLQVFISMMPSVVGSSDHNPRAVAEKCREKIESIGLPPAERSDLVELLSNNFAPERFTPVIYYGRHILGMASRAIDDLLQEVAYRCLEVGCKGIMLQNLANEYPFLEDAIKSHVMRKYRLHLDDLPPWEDEQACMLYEAPLSQEYRNLRPVEVHRALSGGSVIHAIAPVPAQHVMEPQANADAGVEDDSQDKETTSDAAKEHSGDQEEDDDLVSPWP